jgi:hypothetical protein
VPAVAAMESYEHDILPENTISSSKITTAESFNGEVGVPSEVYLSLIALRRFAVDKTQAVYTTIETASFAGDNLIDRSFHPHLSQDLFPQLVISSELVADATKSGKSLNCSNLGPSEERFELENNSEQNSGVPFWKIEVVSISLPFPSNKSTIKTTLEECKGDIPSAISRLCDDEALAILPSVPESQVTDRTRVLDEWAAPVSIDPIPLAHNISYGSAHVLEDSAAADTIHPWECIEQPCDCHEYSRPNEEELDRHINNKQLVSPVLYKCRYVPCPYESKRESICKMHMEKSHGYTYVRSEINSQIRGGNPSDWPLPTAQTSNQQTPKSYPLYEPYPTYRPRPDFSEYPHEGLMNDTNTNIGSFNVSPSAPSFSTKPRRRLISGRGPKSSVSEIRRPKNRCKKLTKSAVAVLEEWIYSHLDDPYPCPQIKGQLANSSGLTENQVSNWLANFRKRRLDSAPYDVQRFPDGLPVEGSQAASRASYQMTPMENWLSSSEDEPASEEYILRALQSDVYSTFNLSNSPITSLSPIPSTDGFEGENQSPEMRSPPSTFHGKYTPSKPASYAGSSRASSAGSAFSQCSDAQLGGPPRRGRKRALVQSKSADTTWTTNKRRRRLEKTQADSVDNDNAISERSSAATTSKPAFQCTFCLKTLSSKTWKRHEETQHLPVRRWTCMLEGFRTEFTSYPYREICIFCDDIDPDDDHMNSCHR